LREHDRAMTTHPAWMLFASRCSALCDRLALFAPGMVATAGVLAMLLAFQQVVASGVQESQARHRADAERADALWRCNAVRSALQRTGCPAQLR
jgi:pheromone shutdown protein TraB